MPDLLTDEDVGLGTTADEAPVGRNLLSDDEVGLKPAQLLTDDQVGLGGPELRPATFLERVRMSPVGRALFGETAEERANREALGGPDANVKPQDLAETAFKFTTPPPYAQQPIKKAIEAAIPGLALSKQFGPKPVQGAVEGLEEFGANFPVGAAGMGLGETAGKLMMGIFAGQYVLGLPAQKQAFDQAVTQKDWKTASTVVTEAALNGTLIGAGAVSEGAGLLDQLRARNAPKEAAAPPPIPEQPSPVATPPTIPSEATTSVPDLVKQIQDLGNALRKNQITPREETETPIAGVEKESAGSDASLPPEQSVQPAPSGQDIVPEPIEEVKPQAGPPEEVTPPSPTQETTTGEKRVVRGLRARRIFDRETEMNGPDILSWITENMPMLSRTSAKKVWGKEKFQLNQSLWDDAPKLERPHHNTIYSPNGSAPDRVAQSAYEAGVIPEPSVNTLWEAVEKASKARSHAYEQQRRHEKILGEEIDQAQAWRQAKVAGEIRIDATELRPGDTMELGGQQVTVTEIDPESGEVTIQDGTKFGRQRVTSGESIYVEKMGEELVDRLAETRSSQQGQEPEKAGQKDHFQAVSQAYGVTKEQTEQLLTTGQGPYQPELELLPRRKAEARAEAGASAVPDVKGAAESNPAEVEPLKGSLSPGWINKAFGKGSTISSIRPELAPHATPEFNVAKRTQIKTPLDFVKLLIPLRSPFVESLKVVLVDAKRRVIHSQVLYSGTVDTSVVDYRDIVRLADQHPEAKGILIAHNHPSGDPTPSDADWKITGRLRMGLDSAGLKLLDHIITNGERYYSFEGGTVEDIPDAVLAAWEKMPRSQLQSIESELDFAKMAASLRGADENHAHIIYANTRLRVTAVERADPASGPVINAILRGIGREGARFVFLDWGPKVPKDVAVGWSQAVRRMLATAGTTTQLQDVASQGVFSFRDAGLLAEPAKAFPASTIAENVLRETPPEREERPAWLTSTARAGLLNTMRAALRAGRRFEDSVTQGVAWLRYHYGNLPGFNLEEARNFLQSDAVRAELEAAEPASLPSQAEEARMPTILQQVPERVRGLFHAADNLRRSVIAKVKTLPNRDIISYLKDAADNIAVVFGRQTSNVILHELNRALGATTAKEAAARTPTREAALTFVVEAGGGLQNEPQMELGGLGRAVDAREQLQNFRSAILRSENRGSIWARKALVSIRFADEHWNELVPVAKLYQRLTDAQNAAENAIGIPTLYRRGGYVFHTQDVTEDWAFPETGGGGTRGGGAPAPFRHIRDYDTYADSIAAGLSPKSLSAVDLLQKRMELGRRLMNYQGWVQTIEDLTDPTTDSPIVTQPVIRRRADGSEDITAPAGYTLTEFGGNKVALHNGYLGLFKSLTMPSITRDSALGRVVMEGATAAKHGLLLFDTFHLGRLAFWNAVSRTGFNRMPGYRAGLLALDNTAFEIRRMVSMGELPVEYADHLIQQKGRLDLLLKHGLNVGNVGDNLYTAWTQKLPVAGRFNKWLFEQYQRGAMSEVGLLEFERVKKARPDLNDDQVARTAAKAVNTRFGNLNSQAWIKSKTFQDLARALFLAPQWNESLIRAELGAVHDVGGAAGRLARGRPPAMGMLARGIGTAVVGTFIMNQLINYATRGKPTWENPEETPGAKISAWIPDYIGGGPGFLLNPLAIPAEITHLLWKATARTGDFSKALLQYVTGRLNNLTKPVYTFFTRRDAGTGRALRNGREVLGSMAAEAIPLPISASAIYRGAKQRVTGENEELFPGQFQKQIMQNFGVKTDQAPSPEQRIRNLVAQWKRSQPGFQENPEFASGPYDEFKDAVRRGNRTDALAALEQLRNYRSEPQIVRYFRTQASHPFTGSLAKERVFVKTLDDEQHDAYKQAREDRRALTQQALDLIRENPREPAPAN